MYSLEVLMNHETVKRDRINALLMHPCMVLLVHKTN